MSRILNYPDPPIQQKAAAAFEDHFDVSELELVFPEAEAGADEPEEAEREAEPDRRRREERSGEETSTRERNGWHVSTTRYRSDDTEVVEIVQTPTDLDSKGWVDKIVGTIPVEIVTAWLFIEGVAETTGGLNFSLGAYWAVFGVVTVLTLLYLLDKSTLEEIDSYWAELRLFVRPLNWRNRRLKTRMLQVLIGTGAFVVWAIYLGGPFDDAFGTYNKSGAIVLVVIFTTALPLFIPTESMDEKLRLKPLEERLRIESTGAAGAVEDESLALRNRGSETIDLAGWTVEDEDDHVYTFPVDTRLRPGAKLTLYSREGDDGRRTRYWNAVESIWDARGETITIADPAGNTIQRPYR